MLSIDQQEYLRTLFNQGFTIRDAQRVSGFAYNTVKSYKERFEDEENGLAPFHDPNHIPEHTRKFLSEIKELLKKGYTNNRVIYRMLKERGYEKSYQTLNSIINKKIKGSSRRNRRSRKLDTKPGEEAQIDWGIIDWIDLDGKKCRLKVFVYVLSYSRMMYAEFVSTEDSKVLRQCMISAFKKLGIPKFILSDNMKTACLKRSHFGRKAEIEWNPYYLETSNFYGFQPKLCTPLRPQEKGKVEAAVKFIKSNFMQGKNYKKRSFENFKKINFDLTVWLGKVNTRIHGSTGEKPTLLWSRDELSKLRFPHPNRTLPITPTRMKRATKDGMVRHNYAYYSIPMEFSSRKVVVREYREHGIKRIRIYFANKVIADHKMTTKRNSWVILEEHQEKVGKKVIKESGTDSGKGEWRRTTPAYDLEGYASLFKDFENERKN